ncbi:MAG: SAM-dependent DNA methyltransferase [Candidatus Sungbacteria bacterium]|nr:SAM-dependent DNA methyltransferase [Candidatus Sungbacteria bacterium]
MPKHSKRQGEITSKTSTRIPNAFSRSVYLTERSGAAILAGWMREIIESRNIDLGPPHVETGAADRKFPDTVIYASRRSQDVLCLMEFKLPFFDPYDDGLHTEARDKANQRGAKYFLTSNFRELILWDTAKANAMASMEEQIVHRYPLSDFYDINRIEDGRYKTPIKKALEQFLTDLYQFSTGKKTRPLLAIDEFLVHRLQGLIQRLAYYYKGIIYDKAHKDASFAVQIQTWFRDQGWNFYPEDDDGYERIARQTAYLLANKILFYNALQLKRPDRLSPLSIPEDIAHGGILQGCLQSFFNQVLTIDYETIYTTDFIDAVAFPENREVVDEIKLLVRILREYDFSTLGYEIVGKIFERLIPAQERRYLGQYFTDPDVVDMILSFCTRQETDKIFDPSCGAGTFLVRAYQQKRMMNATLPHEEILDTLWGSDIAKFPAHLATINLAINDLSVDKNYPRIIQKDFFDLLSSDEQGWEPPADVRSVLLKTMSGDALQKKLPRWFDTLVGNPPYTRQEEISEMSEGGQGYKDRLIEKALMVGDKAVAAISRRAGIYAYFFIHGTKFLKNGGRFGFIVSNAWLDVEYGAGLQRFFLENYKIIAVIESKTERWFADADINTCIVILEKANRRDQKRERDEHLVRFVHVFKRLRDMIPPAQNIWEREMERKRAIENLIHTLLAHDEPYENDTLRIFPKKQSELWDEGFDADQQKYIGAKWGKYIRAPEIFFTILEKGKDKLVPLKQIADVRRGFTTGANEFFYLTEEQIKSRKIEKEFWMHQDGKGAWIPNYIIKSPRECRSIIVDPKTLKYRVLMIHKNKSELKGTNVLKYILDGERKGFHQRPTCASRERWYDLGERRAAHLNVNYLINDVARCLVGNFWASDDFQELHTAENIAPFMNSTLFWFFQNLEGRTSFGGGLLKIQTYEFDKLLVCPSRQYANAISDVFSNLVKRRVESIFSELGAKVPDQVSLDKIKPDRRALDKIIMGDILGLTEDEQLQVYRAVIDLVKSRIDRAHSVGPRRKTQKGLDVQAVVESVVNRIGEQSIKEWYKEKILSRSDLAMKRLPEGDNIPEIQSGLFGWQLRVGKRYISCASEAEAKYLKLWAETGAKSVKVPKDEKYLGKITKDLTSRKSEIDTVIGSYLASILDTKLKSQILHQVWQRII